MIEQIILTIIFLSAVFIFCRKIYRAFSGKESKESCINCADNTANSCCMASCKEQDESPDR